MSEKWKHKYLESPDRCPFCGGTNIETFAHNYQDDKTVVTIGGQCEYPKCGRSWITTYKAVDVEGTTV